MVNSSLIARGFSRQALQEGIWAPFARTVGTAGTYLESGLWTKNVNKYSYTC